MPTLVVRRTYQDGSILFEADLDAFLDDLETFLNVTQINDDNIQNIGITASTKLIDASISTAKLASKVVTTAKIDDSAVTTTQIADNAVTTQKMPDATISTAKIIDGAVTTPKIPDATITTAKIIDAQITTAKIADGAITSGKLARGGYVASSSSGNFSSTGTTSKVPVTNLSVSITTAGGPVMIGLIANEVDSDSTHQSRVICSGSAAAAAMIFKRGSSEMCYQAFGTSTTDSSLYPPGSFSMIDVPSAGTYTYSVSVEANATAALIDVFYCSLFAYELP